MRRWRRGTELPTIFDTQAVKARQLFQYAGVVPSDYIIRECQFWIAEFNALCILTVDTGHHSSGWWKNPDYETCWHFSLSFKDDEFQDAPFEWKTAKLLVGACYGPMRNLVWAEGPYTPDGKRMEVWHYRVFVDTQTLMPIFPRGEVYSKQFTERGWKSWSELKAWFDTFGEAG